jgi:serine/threonine protein kinase
MITRSDLYALGIVAYQIATGRLPFEQGQIWSVQQGKQPVPDPRLFNPSLTEACAQAILKALHPDPVQRFQNARDMALAFGFGQEFHRIQDVTRIRRLSQQETRSTKKTRQGRPVPAGPLKLYNPTSGSIITISPPRAIATRELINPTDTLISRTNGEFLFENNSWHLGEVEAAESANGVYLNDARIIEAQPLCIGDKIRLGETVLTVRG